MNIREFVHLIEDATMAKAVRARHDLARIRYSRTTTTVQSFDEFKHVCIEYYLYHLNFVYGEYRKSDFVIYGEVKNLLCRSFGTIDNAFHEAMTGVNGGLITIFNVICDNLIREQEDMYINCIIDEYINPLETDKKKELISQYLKEYCDPETASKCNVDYQAQNFKDFVDAIRKSRSMLTSKAKML